MRFGAQSKHHLATAETDLLRVMKLALSWEVMDFSVIQGFRGEEAQNKAFDEGNSQKRWPDGNHNEYPSKALDIAPWIDGRIPWKDLRPWYVLAGVVLAAAAHLGVELRWGGAWNGQLFVGTQKFNDLGHFELKRR